jgi:hypothetical protein
MVTLLTLGHIVLNRFLSGCGFVLLAGEIPAGQSNPFGLPAKAPTRRNRPACLAIAFVEDLQEAQRSR